MPSNKKLLQAAAGNAGESLYVEDVFSTYLYDGNGTSQTITNGIDLAGEGGLVWCKPRTIGNPHYLGDTERGINKFLESNATNAEGTSSTTGGNTGDVNAYNADGFSVGSTGRVNQAGQSFASWTFRKAEKFFDVVTYTGNGVDNRQIPHNLGSVPAMIIVKSTSSAGQWPVYHQSLGTGAVRLNLTNAYNSANIWWKTTPTDSHFTVYGGGEVNVSGIEYVAYLFASDAGGFGDDGSESIIKCGSYTGNGTYLDGPVVDLGFEPQWLLIKSTGTESWRIADNMRGIAMGTAGAYLSANLNQAEVTSYGVELNATGFKVMSNNADLNSNGQDYIYIAIRRPMKTPESGTEVFAIDTAVDYTTNPSGKSFDSGFPVDMFLNKEVDQSYNNALYSRLTNKGLRTNTTDSEFNMGGTNWDSNIAVYQSGSTNTNNYGWMFKRATGFFDVVAYTGTGSNTTQSHNLGVAPEMIIVKRRSSVEDWLVYHSATGNQAGTGLNQTNATFTGVPQYWNSTSPTDSVFSLGTHGRVNTSAETYIAYLFASLDGVSKVGSYTGTGSNVDVDCGFSAGARFILIKRTDSTGDWYVWDSVRGIVAGNDPYLLLNSTAAEVTSTDYIDPLASGFTVTSTAPAALNASGGSFVYLAIAQEYQLWNTECNQAAKS